MQLISDIVNDLVNDQISLTVALNKTKVLASRISNQTLLDWVNLELIGYINNAEVPSYRKTSGTIKGDFMNSRVKATNYPIPIKLDNENDARLREFIFYDGISTLEAFAVNNNGTLLYQYPESLIRSIERMLQNTNGSQFHLTNAGVEVPSSFAGQALSKIKDKLLNFMLTLEKEFGIESEIIDLKSNSSKVSYIMNNTIINHGDGNVTNTGHNSTVTANINISKGDKNSLSEMLRKNDVEEEDITELIQVIDEETPSPDGAFGSKVNGWIRKMLDKSLDNTWKIGIGAAGNLLATALKLYYGIGV